MAGCIGIPGPLLEMDGYKALYTISGGLYGQAALAGCTDWPQWQIEMEALVVISDGLDLQSKLH